MDVLYDVPLNASCVVCDVKCDGVLRRRLFDLGIVNGTLITPVLRSPSGDPTAFEVRRQPYCASKGSIEFDCG